MEINITRFFVDADPFNYSHSIAEGGVTAGCDTWNAARDDAATYNLLDTEDKREAFRAHIHEYGAWDETEIAAWDDTDLNALLMQFIAGDIRESGITENSPDDWARYQEASSAGQIAGNMFQGDDGEVYYQLGV